MFGGPIPPAWCEKLLAAIVAARIALTAGLAVIAGGAAAAATPPAWASAVFAITAATAAVVAWSVSGRIVAAPKP